MARKRRPLNRKIRPSYDDSTPQPLKKGERIVSDKLMPAGKDTCNGKLASRDGYCKNPGVANWHRCKVHGGERSVAADVFKKALSVDNACKLQELLNDTLNMDNELASAKVMLVNCMESYAKGEKILEEYLINTPVPPTSTPEDPEYIEDWDKYNKVSSFHKTMVGKLEKYVTTNFARSERLIKILTDGVFKNKKMQEGNKFTLDVQQIRDILRMQIEVMAEHCSGCSTLKKVVTKLKEEFQKVDIENNMSKANREAIGKKKYGEMLEQVEAAANTFVPEEVEAEIIDDEDEELEE